MPPARCARESTHHRAWRTRWSWPGRTRRDANTSPPTSPAIGVRSSMAAPLGRAAPIAGALAVARSQVRPFDATEMATLEAFAAQAAIAIETARAQQRARRSATDALDRSDSRRQTATADSPARPSAAVTGVNSTAGVSPRLAAAAAATVRRRPTSRSVSCHRDASMATRVHAFWDPIRGSAGVSLPALSDAAVGCPEPAPSRRTPPCRPAGAARRRGRPTTPDHTLRRHARPGARKRRLVRLFNVTSATRGRPGTIVVARCSAGPGSSLTGARRDSAAAFRRARRSSPSTMRACSTNCRIAIARYPKPCNSRP